MFQLTDTQLDQARDAIHSAAHRDDVRASIITLYQDVQKQIDQRRPLCILSGRCCHFEDFGHNLYVTTLELAKFLHDLRQLPSSPPPILPTSTGCPFQLNKLCSVHSIRPFGCRIFFCDSTATEWQQEQYQIFHNRLRQLHDQLEVPYFYLEWRQALGLVFPTLQPITAPVPGQQAASQ
jgi:Fe-S-cluster containining protein